MLWKAPFTVRLVGAGGTSRLGTATSFLIMFAEDPDVKVEPADSVAMPESIKSLAVIARSSGSPRLPARTSKFSFRLSANRLS